MKDVALMLTSDLQQATLSAKILPAISQNKKMNVRQGFMKFYTILNYP